MAEGLPPEKCWALYLPLEEAFSLRAVRTLLGWVRHQLIAEARAAGRSDLIGLFRRDPLRLRQDSTPTLDEFAAAHPEAGAFSEAELLALWQAEFGQPGSAQLRRAQLGRRLRDALDLLAHAPRRLPAATDPVASWFAPHLARRLVAAGLGTLAEVASALQQRQSVRWTAVAGIGAVHADRLDAWLKAQGISAAPAAESGLRVGPRFLPFEQGLAATADQADRSGDRQAVARWLQVHAHQPHTLRSYRRSAERLLLWCELERQTTLGALTAADCSRYRLWLSTLGRQSTEAWAAAGWTIPAQAWIAQRRAIRRDSADWRPFAGPLSPASVTHELLLLQTLFGRLRDEGHLAHQPWGRHGRPNLAGSEDAVRRPAADPVRTRGLDAAQWDWVLQGLGPAVDDRSARLRALLWLSQGCGLGAAEMLSLRLGSLQPGPAGWQLQVQGRGGAMRVVPLPAPAQEALLDYLASVDLGLDALLRSGAPDAADAARAQQPLLRSQRGRRSAGRAPPSSPLRYTTLYGDLKRYLEQRAGDLAASDPDGAARLRQASAQWLRHGCAARALDAGVPLRAVQQLLGHASLQTTVRFLRSDTDGLQAVGPDIGLSQWTGIRTDQIPGTDGAV